MPTLIWALDDRDSYVRIAAATALGAIGADAKPAASALLTALQNTEKHVTERRNIVEALGHIGERQSVPKLVPFLEDPTIADIVAETIETLSGQAFMRYRDTKETRSYFDMNRQPYIVVSAR